MNADLRRLGLTLACLALPGVALGYRVAIFEPPTTRVDLDTIPAHLGPYVLQREEQLDADTLAVITPVQYVMRMYDDGQRPVWLYAGYYGDRLGVGAHEPSVCYPALGWDVLSSRNAGIEMHDGSTLHARILIAELDGRRELVLYWFQPRDRWPASPWVEELAKIRDAIVGSPEYTFVRISAPFLPDERLPEISHLVQQVAPAVRRAMSSASGGGEDG